MLAVVIILWRYGARLFATFVMALERSAMNNQM